MATAGRSSALGRAPLPLPAEAAAVQSYSRRGLDVRPPNGPGLKCECRAPERKERHARAAWAVGATHINASLLGRARQLQALVRPRAIRANTGRVDREFQREAESRSLLDERCGEPIPLHRDLSSDSEVNGKVEHEVFNPRTPTKSPKSRRVL